MMSDQPDTMKRKPRKFFIRTVKDGSVTIDGVTYRPVQIHMSYDGRLDGHRFAFHRYISYDGKPGGVEPFIALWGTEEAARGQDVDPLAGPHLVDGSYPWNFWDSRPDRLFG